MAVALFMAVAVFAAACGRVGAGPHITGTPSIEPTHVFRSVVPSLSTVPTPCPSPTSNAAGVEVTYFDAPNGGCIAAEQLRQYRCGHTVDPVIEAGGLGVLGGRVAVMGNGLPAAAGPIGHGGGQDLFVAPGDRPTLYVRTDDGRIRRWLTVPGASAQPQALVVGDSITVGSRAAIVRALPGWSVAFRAQVG